MKALMPGLAVLLVSAVLGGQLATGGGEYVPSRPADPCRPRAVTAALSTLDLLSETVVLLGADAAACRLHLSREALVLGLAQSGSPSDARVAAVRAGLLSAVDRLDREHRLPNASALADEALRGASLNPLVRRAIGLLPDSIIDARIQTDDVLRRAVRRLDVRDVLEHVQDPDRLRQLVSAAVTASVRDEVLEGLT